MAVMEATKQVHWSSDDIASRPLVPLMLDDRYGVLDACLELTEAIRAAQDWLNDAIGSDNEGDLSMGDISAMAFGFVEGFLIAKGYNPDEIMGRGR